MRTFDQPSYLLLSSSRCVVGVISNASPVASLIMGFDGTRTNKIRQFSVLTFFQACKDIPQNVSHWNQCKTAERRSIRESSPSEHKHPPPSSPSPRRRPSPT